MIDDSTFVPTLIEAGRSIKIENGAGAEVCNLQGVIWITQEGDQRDIVLMPGDRFTLDRSGLTLLVALENAALAHITETADRSTLADLASLGVVDGRRCSVPKAERRDVLAA